MTQQVQGEYNRDSNESTKSWLATHMAQFMVFLNGLILTLTAYFTLSIFITEMYKESIDEKSSVIFSKVSHDFRGFDRSFSVASSIIEEKQRLNILAIKGMAPDITHFSGLIIMDPDTAKKAKGIDHYGETPDDFFLQQDVLKHKHIVNHKRPPTISFHHPNPDEIDRSYIVIRKPIQYKGKSVFLYGFLPLHSWVWSLKETQKVSFKGLDIYMKGKPVLGITFERQETQNAESPLIHSIVTDEMDIFLAQNLLKVVASLYKDQRAAFLEKIPFLLLMFGLTLTLIGTLYVRNNQKQSSKLADMNRVLAMKNLELNNEISNRERLNEMIQKAEKENSAILNAVSDIIFELNAEFELLFLNQAWTNITGFNIDQSIGRNITELFHPQDIDEQEKYFKKLLSEEEEPKRNYARLKTHNGTYRSVEVNVSMLRHDESNVLRIVGTITDVEERRRAERALGEAEKKYRTIVENAAGGIYQITLEGNFLSANPALAGILGYETPEELLRGIKNINNDIYLEADERSKFLDHVKRSDEAVYQEVRARKADQSLIWIAENSRAVKNEDGDVLYFEGSIEDISERKEAEEALKEAKIKSDLANRTKSEFLAHMSHELRTPLNSIIGFSEIIKNQVFGPIGQEAYWEYARDIHDSGKSLLNVINNILDVSRIEVGERQLNESLIDVQKIIPLCLQLMSPKMEAKNLSISFDSRKALPKIIGEELALKQMLMSLLSNAIKFSSSGGLVTVGGEIDNMGDFKLSVTDTGAGMSDDEIKKALAPFNKDDKEGAGWNGSGIGLGLTLTDSLVKLHGGRIELISKKGVGTTATLVFPSKRVARQSGAPTTETSEKKLSKLVSKDYLEEGAQEDEGKTIH